MNVGAVTGRAVLTGDVEALLAHARSVRGVASRRHARDLLSRALLCADPGSVSAAQRKAARALGADDGGLSETLELPRHAVLVPLVIEPLGVGLVRAMRVAFDGSAHGGYVLPLDATASRSVSDALSAATSYLKREVSAGYCMTTVHPSAFAPFPSAMEITGPSLGAATFVSAVSLLSGRAVKPGTLVTGKLVGRRVESVGALDAKLHAALHRRHDVMRVVVPHASLAQAKRSVRKLTKKVEVIGIVDVNELAEAALLPTSTQQEQPRHRLMDLRRASEKAWQGFAWANVRQQAEQLLTAVPERNVDLRVELLAMLSAAQEHLGSPLQARTILDEALAIANGDEGKKWVPDQVMSRLHQRLALNHRARGNVTEARRDAKLAVRAAERGRLRDELYKSHGCIGLVELAAGEAKHAVKAFSVSLELVHQHAPESCVRSHGYLIDALAQNDEHEQAAHQYALALEHLHATTDAKRRANLEAWLRTNYAAGLWRMGASADVHEVLDVPCVREAIEGAALPGMIARRTLGLAWLALGHRDKGQSLLSASPMAYGPGLGPSLVLSAHINVMCEGWALLSSGAWDQDIAGRVLTAVDHVPDYLRHGAIGRAYELAKRALQAPLGKGNAQDRTRDALGGLIHLCGRIA